MRTKVKKAFLDINKEEEWLNLQGEQGMMLVGYHHGEYEFENAVPAKFQYKIDLPQYTGEKKRDYLDFLSQDKITVAAQYGGRVYLMKNQADGPLELYTDFKDQKNQAAKRYSFMFGVAISQLFFGILLLTRIPSVAVNRPAFWILIVFGIGFLISSTVFFILGLLKRKKYAVKRKDEGIWE